MNHLIMSFSASSSYFLSLQVQITEGHGCVVSTCISYLEDPGVKPRSQPSWFSFLMILLSCCICNGYSSNRALASLACLQLPPGSLSLSLVFQAHVPSNAMASTVTPSLHLSRVFLPLSCCELYVILAFSVLT